MYAEHGWVASGSRLRWAVLALIAASWPLMVARMWIALWTVPSAELLQRERLVRIPTVETFWHQTLVSGAELVVLVALLWPRWRAGYPIRLLTAGAGTFLWIVFTAPMGITSLQRVHRQWLLLVVGVCATALLLGFAAGILRRLRSGRGRGP
jgi:hypothetical protein